MSNLNFHLPKKRKKKKLLCYIHYVHWNIYTLIGIFANHFVFAVNYSDLLFPLAQYNWCHFLDRATVVDHFFLFYFPDDFGAGDDDFVYFCHVAQLQGVESYCYRVGLC